jgi:hypothetical protein
MKELDLGISAGMGAFTWGLLFFVGTLGVGLFVVFRCHTLLSRAKRPALGTTLLFALLGCLVMPVAGGFAGCAIGAQRGAAHAYDEVDPGRAVLWGIERGVEELKKELQIDDNAPVAELEKLRGIATANVVESEDEGIEDTLRRLFWWAVKEVLDQKLPPEMTYREAIALVEERLKAKVREELPDVGGKLRKASWFTLGIFLAVAILAFGGALFYTRRAAAQP